MKIETLPLGEIGANCYLISTEKAAVAIDIGFDSEYVKEFFANSGDSEKLILLTHAHFDHIGGAKAIRDNLGVKIAIGSKDAPALSDTRLNLSDSFHAGLTPFRADIALNDSEKIKCGDLEFGIIETSGHTKGGVCYLLKDMLFSGDTLFCEGIGRTDFFGGDFKDITLSVKRLYTLPEETVVYPGHGEATTIGHEKKFNPYVRG